MAVAVEDLGGQSRMEGQNAKGAVGGGFVKVFSLHKSDKLRIINIFRKRKQQV